MARFNKESKYDLKHPFKDSAGNHYRPEYAKELRAHIQMTPLAPTDRGPHEFTRGSNHPDWTGNPAANSSAESQLVYEIAGDPAAIPVHRVIFGKNEYWSMKTADSSNEFMWLDETNGQTSFSTVADGGAPSAPSDDLPFSISFWAKVETDAYSSYNFILAKETPTTGHHWEYGIYIDGAGQVNLRLQNWLTSDYIGKKANLILDTYRWYHMVVTYDGSGVVSGIKWYIDGIEEAGTGVVNGTYAGMAPSYDRRLYIGSNAYDPGQHQFDGSIAEVALWGAELSAEAVAAIYNITREAEPIYISGITNNPPRTLLRSMDSLDGAYPPTLRDSTSDFMGKGLHPFDDLNTPTFTSNFAKAEIQFVPHENSPIGGVVFEDLTFIGLTGSITSQAHAAGKPTPVHTFTFVNGASTPDIKVITYHDDVRVQLSGSSSPEFIAKAFAEQVNQQAMGIHASSVGPKVNLLMQIPNTGSHIQHSNIIVTGNLKNFQMDPDNPIKVNQFSEISNANIKYPFSLPTSYFSRTNASANPHESPSIDTTGISLGGLDTVVYVPKYSDESLKPFDDSRVYIDFASPFYSEGTSSKTFDGFRGPLKSKTAITFDLISDSSGDGLGTHIFYATSSLAAGTDVKHKDIVGKSGSGMAYWNSSLRRWEMLEPEILDVHSFLSESRAKACLGFSPSAGHVATSPSISSNNNTFFLDLASTVGNPISEFGFPLAKQYNATSSQCYDMSNYISSPFLVEKIVLDVEGEFGLSGQEVGDTDQPYFKQFFVLNQPTHPDSPHVTGTFHTDHVKQTTVGDAASGGSTSVVEFEMFGRRELIGYAKIGFIREDHESAPILGSNALRLSDAKKDLTDHMSFLPEAAFMTNYGVTGSFKVEFEPSVASFSKGTSLLSIRASSTNELPGTHDYILLTNKGGATCTGDLSGRQIGSSFSNFPVIKTLDKDEDGDTTLPRQIRHHIRKHSPYLLMPKDRLVFGWQNHCMQPAATSEMTNIGNLNANRTDRQIATKLVDRIKRAKVTLFGSYIANEREFHHGYSQSLTSNTVYETVGNDPILDQFDVGELVMLSGSMSDAIMTGKFLGGNRRRICSVASGESGVTGSLNRNIKQFHGHALYKDSVFIDPFSSKKGIPTVTVGTSIGGVAGNSDTSIVIMDPRVEKQGRSVGTVGDTVTVGGVSVPTSVAVNNFIMMFPEIMDGSFFHLTEQFAAPLDIIAGGGVTDPPPEGDTAGQFVSFPVGNAATLMAMAGDSDPADADGGSGGGYMLDALSVDPASFGSKTKDAGAQDKDASSGGGQGDFAMQKFMDHHSPGQPAYGGAALKPDTLIVEIDQAGSTNVVKGSKFNKPGLLADYDFDATDTAVGYLEDAMYRHLIGTCVGPDPATSMGTGGGTLTDAAGFFVPAGFNYGFSHALPTPPSYFFNRRHYGHFADMVETPGETATMVRLGAKASPAVRVRFFSRGGEPHVDPITTNSQNLSIFCTSSMPYDEGPGAKRDRSSTQPDLKDVISISESMELDLES